MGSNPFIVYIIAIITNKVPQTPAFSVKVTVALMAKHMLCGEKAVMGHGFKLHYCLCNSNYNQQNAPNISFQCQSHGGASD